MLRVFGIRHHGPGSARSLRAALHSFAPDILLVEGPPDADARLAAASHPKMRPPVALLIYRPDRPQQSVFYPFAEYSPEWQAITYAAQTSVPIRFCDLPQAHSLALEEPTVDPEAEPSEQVDPFLVLSLAAGYSDPESWWDSLIEGRLDSDDLFDAIRDAFATVRETLPAPTGLEALREAWMRRRIRGAEREGFQRIAVVCGAWHAPALSPDSGAAQDAALLEKLPKVKVESTWVPWTNFRLSYYSGYGAGIRSPGWYSHLWQTPNRATAQWVARAASLIRSERLEAPTSNAIDAVRLAETLATLRGRRIAGLDELRDAIQTTLCSGNEAPMLIIERRLEVGDLMGEVPAEACDVPLLHDVESSARRLRLTLSDEQKELDLDLRKPFDLERSRLLHRLGLLGVPWGRQGQVSGALGTFHELWIISWAPEFAIVLIERNAWGNTLVDAAGGYVRNRARSETELAALSGLLRGVIMAGLDDAVEAVVEGLANRAAAAGVQALMESVRPLAEAARYGDVRGTRAESLFPILDGLLERIVAELPGACIALDADAARTMLDAMTGVQAGLQLLDRTGQLDAWIGVLSNLGTHPMGAAHALIRGWCCRTLLEYRRLAEGELERLARISLSPAQPSDDAAAWIEGLLRGSALLVLQEDGLWSALDAWLVDLEVETFEATLPLLRRAFSSFSSAERRQMGRKVATLGVSPDASASAHQDTSIDRERADLVLPVLAHVLGIELDG